MSAFQLEKYRTTESNNYSHVSMSGGKYKIPFKKFNDLYKYIEQNQKNSLCERLLDTYPLFFDIDDLDTNITIEDVIKNIDNVIKKLLTVKDNNMKYYITENQSKSRYYHVHYPKIYVNKVTALKIANDVNQSYKKDICDKGPYKTGSLRMFHTLKYDRNKKTYIENSCHKIINEDELPDMCKNNIVKQMKLLCVRVQKNATKYTVFYKNYLDNRLDSISVQSKSECLSVSKSVYQNSLIKNVEYILYQCLNVDKRLNDWNNWKNIIYYIKNIQSDYNINLKNLAIKWSKQSKHYVEDNNWINKQIDKIYSDNRMRNGPAYGKLCKIAKEDNIQNFYNLVKGVSKYDNEITDLISIKFIRRCFYKEEMGDAELFAKCCKMHQQRVVCTSTRKGGKFYYWSGNLWEEDTFDFIKCVMACQLPILYIKLKKHISKEIETEIDNNNQTSLTKEKKELCKRIKMCQTYRYINNVYHFLSSELYINKFESRLNQKKDILSIENGVIDLKTGILRKRTIEDYCTFYLDITYNNDLNISTKNIFGFFKEIMLNNTDLVNYLQIFLGYCITGNVSEQKFTIFWGALGGNGKTVLIELLRDLLEEGKYYATLSADSLLKQRKSAPGSATPHLLPLMGARIAILDESDKAVKLNEGMIKRITGNNSLTVRPLYQEEITFENCCKPILVTNFRPDISNDCALDRRLILIPFDAEFKSTDDYDKNNSRHILRDTKKVDKLKLCRDELLVWLLKGAIEWYKHGLLQFPEKIKTVTQKYKEQQDPLARFLNDTDICEFPHNDDNASLDTYFTPFDEFHMEFINESDEVMSKKDFKEMMTMKGHPLVSLKVNNTKRKGYEIKLVTNCLI